MTFFLSELIIRSLSLLLKMFNNSTTSFFDSLSYPNACFNIYFRSILKIFLFWSTRFLAQVLLI